MTFTTIKLMNERVLVQGTDVFGGSGKTTLDASQWNELALRKDVSKAQEAFDQAVEEFYKPIMEAAEAAAKVVEKPEDSTSFIVIEEGTEGVAHQPKQIVKLTRDSIILRLIEQGNTDRLVWVDDELEILEASVAKQAPATTSGDAGLINVD